MYNHGFYNINPTWFKDFYSKENGFEIIAFEAFTLCNGGVSFPMVFETEFFSVPEGTLLTMVARKNEHKEMKWPMQGKYKK